MALVRLTILAATAVAFVLLSSACRESDANNVSGEVVATEGGAVTLGDEITLRIPPDALSADATVSITRVSKGDAGDLEGAQAVGSAFDVDLGGAELSAPATLEMAFDPGKLPKDTPEEAAFLAYYDEEAEVWIPVGGRVDPDRDMVIIETDHLSWWQPWTWNWDAWIAVIKKTLSLNLSEWAEAFALLTEGCEPSGTNASVDESRANKVIQGCVVKDDPNSPEFRVVNIKSFYLGVSPAADGPGYPPAGVLAPGEAVTFAASTKDKPPATVYADFTEPAMWRFIVGLVLRMLPGGEELPNEGIAFIADGLQRVVNASEVSAALEAGDPAAFADALFELITSEPFIKTFAELASRYGAEHGIDMLKRWTEAGIRQVFLGVAAVDVIGSATDFIFTYVTNNQSAVAFNWTHVKPTPTPEPTPRPLATTVITFEPGEIDPAGAEQADCWGSSLWTKRVGAFRCVTAGSRIYDPCFGEGGQSPNVLCPLDPTIASDDVVLQADYTNFTESGSPRPGPWFFITSDAHRCAKVGAPELTPSGFAFFRCLPALACLEPAQHGVLWKVDCFDTTTDARSTHDIETIWF